MRKFFFLIPAMLLSLAMSATIHEIGPGDPETVVNDLLIAKLQSSAVVDGDVIELKDGIYSEYSNYLFFNKSVEVRAAEGAHPIVEVECYIKIGESAPGKNITIRGIKFDASKQDATGNQSSSYSHFIRVYSAGTLDFENCEFYGCKNQVIEVESSNSVENLIVNNCYFRDITNTCIYVQNTSESNLTITNSTFANIDATGVSAGIIDTKAATGTVVVDHCTFYDCKAKNTDYGVIGHNGSFTSDFTVSNSIFAWGTMYDKRATYLPSGTAVSNCLTYNTNKDTDKWGHHSGPTFSNCMLQDPLFNDLANNKYTYAGTYGVSMSPARGVGTDGSDLGDPRWYTPATYPETDFSGAGYTFTAALANAPEIEKNTHYGEDAPYLRYTGSTPTYAEATWMIKATRACNVKVTVNMANNAWEGKPDDTYQNGKHIFGVELWNSNNVRVDTVAEDTYGNGKKDGYNTYPTVELGSIEIPAAGVYTVKLLNPRAWSKCGVASVKMVYEGGAVVNIPNTIPFADAMLSTRAYVDGTGLHFTDNDHLATISNEYAKWNIHAEGGVYTFTAHCSSTNWSHLKIRVLNGNTELYTFNTEYAYNQGDKEISSPSWFLAEGDYVLELSNPANHSNGYLLSLAATSDASIFVVDENATDVQYIEDMNGVSKKVLINRTFKGGMYNTLCIPVEPGLGELESVFGTGYELLEMTSAELEDNTLNLIFANASAVLAGKPYLIKPVEDVKNPIIPQHGIHNYAYNHTVACTNADFIGSFIAGEVPAGEDYLFLGPNNLLYFSQTATPIKGTRAYFQLKGIPHPQQVIKHARIVTGTQVITAIDLVEENTNTIKTIENGQIVIIRDGVRYNVMGTKIQ